MKKNEPIIPVIRCVVRPEGGGAVYVERSGKTLFQRKADSHLSLRLALTRAAIVRKAAIRGELPKSTKKGKLPAKRKAKRIAMALVAASHAEGSS